MTTLLALSFLAAALPMTAAAPTPGVYCGGWYRYDAYNRPYACEGETTRWDWGGTYVTLCIGVYYFWTGHCESGSLSLDPGSSWTITSCEENACGTAGVTGLKGYCEPYVEWREHLYGPGLPGTPILGPHDGSGGQDCDGDGLPGDLDGHPEHAFGGAWLAVFTVPECGDEEGHHPPFGPVAARDGVLGDVVSFTVGADTVDLTGLSPCGDGIVDERAVCVGSCIVTFPPGLDGRYAVQTEGTSGWIWSG